MKQIELAEVSENLLKFVKQAKSNEIVIAIDGKPVGYLHGFADDDEVWEYQLLNNPHFIRSVEDARRDFRAGRYYTSEQVHEMVEQRELEERKSRKKSNTMASEAPAEYGDRKPRRPAKRN